MANILLIVDGAEGFGTAVTDDCIRSPIRLLLFGAWIGVDGESEAPGVPDIIVERLGEELSLCAEKELVGVEDEEPKNANPEAESRGQPATSMVKNETPA